MRERRILRIGKIPYANLFPLFFVLERDADCSHYDFVEGMPSDLNRMLRQGRLDLSPSSSVEYLREPSRYGIIDGHSVSARGPVGSVFLFSRRPIEETEGVTIAVTSHSETSVALLRVIMMKFLGISCSFEVSARPLESPSPAVLLIGDEALRYRALAPAEGFAHAYDLGEFWYRRTGLPFVFALWIVRKEVLGRSADADGAHSDLLRQFVGDLDRAKTTALRELPLIARHSPLRASLPENEILSYWDKLDYDLGPEHRRSLDLFGSYLVEAPVSSPP